MELVKQAQVELVKQVQVELVEQVEKLRQVRVLVQRDLKAVPPHLAGANQN